MMEFAQQQSGDVLVVRLTGRLDSSAAPGAEQDFAGVLGDGAPHIAIDLSDLEYISSAGLRVLLIVAKKVQQAHGKIALCGLTPNVREIFAISGFDAIFSIQPDAAAAIAAVR